MADSPLLEEQRENWGSRTGFILAAIGSAVGLGNLWGFPYKLYAYGGGAFLIPYLFAMLVIGIPILILEFSLGHMTQRAAPEAYKRVGRKKEPVGWWGIILGFVIITYYPVILAWCLSYLWFSLEGIIWHGGQLPFAATSKGAQNFFQFDFANAWTDADGAKPWDLGGIQPHLAASLAVVWILMLLCIVKGVKLVGKVVIWTVPLPWLMLMILMFNGLTQPGAVKGLAYYLNPEWSQLAKPNTWVFAFGQVFFSMSLAFGVMLTYASFLHRKSDINNNAAIIGLGDLATSFIAGIAVFSTLGAMSVAANVPVDSVIGDGTVGLAFMAFPYSLAQLPHSAWFGLAFFFALITLGIDSAFSITESVLASLVDKTGWNRTATLWGLTFVGFALGLVYCSQGGLNWLEYVDGFINGPWGIALLGLLECVVLGWTFHLPRLREHANERSDWKLGPWWDWNIRIFVPVILSALFAWYMYDKLANPRFLYAADGSLNYLSVTAIGLAVAAPVLAIILSLFRTRAGGGQKPASLLTQPSDSSRQARIGALAASTGIVLSILVGTVVIATGYQSTQLSPDGKLVKTPEGEIVRVYEQLATDVPMLLLVLAIVSATALGLVGTVIGAVRLARAEREGKRPTLATRIAGILGTLSVGLNTGMALALIVLVRNIAEKTAKHSETMTATAYAVMAVMLGILVFGLGWCFVRAIKAGGSDEEPQLSEE
ncbi:MAG: sodium-dependent transporter [Phycisphaerae bacterium]